MPRRLSFARTRAVLAAELAANRRRGEELDAGDIASFTLPLLLGLLGILAIAVVPLVVVRNSADSDSQVVPLVGAFALTAVCTAVAAWMTAIILSAAVVMILYRTRPRQATQVVVKMTFESFGRVEDTTGRIALLAVIAGLLALAVGLPSTTPDSHSGTVLDDLLAAQVAALVVALSVTFMAESIRCAADIVDDKSLLLAWPWALVIACVSWALSTTVGPLETTRMLSILLQGWLPPMVDDQPRNEVIKDLLPASARWWAAFGPLPLIAALWAYQAWRLDGFVHIREFLGEQRSLG